MLILRFDMAIGAHDLPINLLLAGYLLTTGKSPAALDGGTRLALLLKSAHHVNFYREFWP